VDFAFLETNAPRILIVRLSAIGDVIQATPIACALREHFPKAFIAWTVEGRTASLLAGHKAIDEVIPLKRGWLKSPGGVWQLRRRLHELKFDIALEAQGLTKAAILAWLSGAKRRIGFGKPWGRELSPWMNTEVVDTPEMHVVKRNLALLQPLGIESPRVEFDLPEREEDRLAAEKIISSSFARCKISSFPRSGVGTQFPDAPASAESPTDVQSLTRSKDAGASKTCVPTPERGNEEGKAERGNEEGKAERGNEEGKAERGNEEGKAERGNEDVSGFAIINPGAGWPSKLWPTERFAAVAEYLGKKWSLPTLVVWAGNKEKRMAEEIAAHSGGHAQVGPNTSLTELAALARRARLFLGSDTGPLHLAAAVGTPCVGLYGPWPAKIHGPYGPRHIALQKAFFDGPTHKKRTAPKELMEAIEIGDVCEACDEILKR
jgi:ADP-heptose:LPS heptosyltransferase